MNAYQRRKYNRKYNNKSYIFLANTYMFIILLEEYEKGEISEEELMGHVNKLSLEGNLLEQVEYVKVGVL